MLSAGSPGAHLFYSEKQSIKKNMGDVFCFCGIFVAVKFQL